MDLTLLLLSLAVLLMTARALGELADRFGQPTVLGEIVAGVLLGPTLLGRIAPELAVALFPLSGPRATVLEGLFLLSIVLFMLVAGLEVDLSHAIRRGKTAAWVGIAGIALPFAMGFGAAWFAPNTLGYEAQSPLFVFALFVATALSISALPVIAKTLMDLGLYYTDIGVVVLSAAIFSDLFGWLFFAFILGLMGADTAQSGGIGVTVALVLGYVAVMLTLVRWLLHRALPWVQAHTTFPGGVMGLALGMALCGAAFTEWAGVHAIFGAFLAGVAIGDSPHLRNHTRTIIRQFVAFFFAPLFFASIGLKVDFAAHFDLVLVLALTVLACAGKIIGCGAAGILAGMPRREACAVGLALNARGAMEIILGMLALRYGVINERLFVALVIMALVTSMLSGIAIPAVLRRSKSRKIEDYLSSSTFIGAIAATSIPSIIAEFSNALAPATGVTPDTLMGAVRDPADSAPKALGNGVAVWHPRLDLGAGGCLGAAISSIGIDVDAPDGQPAHILFFLVSPRNNDGVELELLADIADRFSDSRLHEKLAGASSYTEFLALLRTRGV